MHEPHIYVAAFARVPPRTPAYVAPAKAAVGRPRRRASPAEIFWDTHSMDARLTQAEDAYLIPAAPAQERDRAQHIAAAEAYQAGLGRGLARLGDALFGWVQRARLRAELAALSDRDLADIGLTRGEIGRAVAAATAPADQQQGRRPSGLGVARPA